jgi:hypothetical protein
MRQIRGLTIILLRRGLDARSERFALTEELIHDERTIKGSTLPSLVYGDMLNIREERRVRQLALCRLIPDSAVLQMEEQIRFLGGFSPWSWADELDVPPHCVWERFVDVWRRARGRGLAWPSDLLHWPPPGSLLAYKLAAPVPIYRTAVG